ncbi:hypothetical protein [Granulicella cerasi]|uniref:hypothetical protein n=1 Tax=Granulicella cerasi TaxID=741063 RepID=UPI0021E07AC6|nr:hypothetical protein [Granulicella cerasi]
MIELGLYTIIFLAFIYVALSRPTGEGKRFGWKVGSGRELGKQLTMSAYDYRRHVNDDPGGGRAKVIDFGHQKQFPDDWVVETLSEPVLHRWCRPFISAKASVDGVECRFHAYLDPRSTRRCAMLYYFVEAPSTKHSVRGDFHVSGDFRWIGDRPADSLLILYTLKQWRLDPDFETLLQTEISRIPDVPTVHD